MTIAEVLPLTVKRQSRASTSSRAQLVRSNFIALADTVDPVPPLELCDVLAGRTEAPVAIEDFRDYLLAEEQGAEALDFFLAVEHLKLVSAYDREHKRATASQGSLTSTLTTIRGRDPPGIVDFIIFQFIRPGAPEEIALGSAERTEILRAHHEKEFTLELLLPAQRQCHGLLLATSFPRFRERAAQNIGPVEVSQRKKHLVIASILTILLIILSFAVSSYPRGARWVIIIPAWYAAISVLQVRYKFCFIYGSRGMQRWDGYGMCGLRGREKNVHVKDTCVRTNHRRRVLLFNAIALLFGTLVAGIVYVIPANT